ncbi:MAG: serine--tRNA ligase [Bauldia sp.]|nr:serine--tRNA ligase [Bauldia sp.]
MLDIKWIRDNPAALADALVKRGSSPGEAQAVVDTLIAKDETRRAHLVKLQTAQERRNAASKEIGKAKAAKDEAAAAALMAEVAELKTFLGDAEDEERRLDAELRDALAVVANVPLADVPVGPDEKANVIHRQWGTPGEGGRLTQTPRPAWPKDFAPKEHFEIGEPLGMDFAAAAKLSGARFVVLKGELARLERALGQFMLDLHTREHGYTEVAPPLLVRDDVMFGTGQLPKFREDLFATLRPPTATEQLDFYQQVINEYLAAVGTGRPEGRYCNDLGTRGDTTNLSLTQEGTNRFNQIWLSRNGFWLIPTAEVPLTNLVRDAILSEAELPMRYTALTPCFRSEAGAAGRDTRGMLRQHQFDKVELVSVTTPEQSSAEHERMLTCAEAVLQRLDLPYRVMTLSTGDMGFSAQKTWDIEVWLPGQGTYREISSCSVCGDFQARRMEARYRPAEGKGTRHVHTLNGSGVAVGRALIAVLETYQNPDGSVTVPSALAPYMGGVERIGG